MKNNISWQVLILIGLVGALIGYFIGGVIGSAIGVFGDICFLIGVANMVVAWTKNRKIKNINQEVAFEKIEKGNKSKVANNFLNENWFKIILIIILIAGLSVATYLVSFFVTGKNKVEQENQANSQKFKSEELDSQKIFQQNEKCKSLSDEYLKNIKNSEYGSTYIREIHFSKKLNTCLIYSEGYLIDTISRPAIEIEYKFVTDLLTNKRLIRLNYKNKKPDYATGGLTPSEFESQKNKLMNE